MIKIVLTATCAFALMSGMALAQSTSGGTARGPNSPTSKNSGVSLSTGQSQPLTGYSNSTPTTGVDNTQGSATGGPGATPNGGPQSAPMPTPAPSGDATVTASAPMPQSAMPATPTMVANTPAGDAPSTYPKCTHKGQDRCMSMARR